MDNDLKRLKAIDFARTHIFSVHRNMMALSITRIEKEILEKISQGQSSAEIAAALLISQDSVVNYKEQLMIKMDAGNAANLVRKGFECGLLKI